MCLALLTALFKKTPKQTEPTTSNSEQFKCTLLYHFESKKLICSFDLTKHALVLLHLRFTFEKSHQMYIFSPLPQLKTDHVCVPLFRRSPLATLANVSRAQTEDTNKSALFAII